MKKPSFTNQIGIFFSALIMFNISGWIGWLGIIFIILKAVGVIHWSWWIAALPLEYGVVYCLYMTIDGAKYRAGLKDAGAYARFTSPFLKDESESLQIQTIIKEGPDYIGETIDQLCNVKNRMKFNQALLDASLEHYFLLQLAMLGNKGANAYDTIKKWREAGLKLPAEGTPEFYPYDDKAQKTSEWKTAHNKWFGVMPADWTQVLSFIYKSTFGRAGRIKPSNKSYHHLLYIYQQQSGLTFSKFRHKRQALFVVCQLTYTLLLMQTF